MVWRGVVEYVERQHGQKLTALRMTIRYLTGLYTPDPANLKIRNKPDGMIAEPCPECGKHFMETPSYEATYGATVTLYECKWCGEEFAYHFRRGWQRIA